MGTNTSYDKAYAYLKRAAEKDLTHPPYEIVEDTYKFENGLLLIVYKDSEHKEEDWHMCVNIDDFTDDAEAKRYDKAFEYLKGIAKEEGEENYQILEDFSSTDGKDYSGTDGERRLVLTVYTDESCQYEKFVTWASLDDYVEDVA